MFKDVGLPSVIKTDGAKYFTSSEIKGYFACKRVLIKTISVARSNANRVERYNRTIRAFLNRRGRDWATPESLYELTLYMNSINTINSAKYGSLTPYELSFGYKPEIMRFLTVKYPSFSGEPIQTEVKFGKFSSERNQSNERLIKRAKTDQYKSGATVMYRKDGRKSARMASAVIEYLSPGKETVTLRTPNNQLITRHITDVILN